MTNAQLLSGLNRVLRRGRVQSTVDRVKSRHRPSQPLRARQLIELSDQLAELLPKPPLANEVDRYLRMATEQRGQH